MSSVLEEIVRRGLIDLLHECGGEHNHGELTALMNEMGHSVARRDVLNALAWLSAAGLVTTEALDLFTVAAISSDGIDVACGRLRVEGVSRFKTGA